MLGSIQDVRLSICKLRSVFRFASLIILTVILHRQSSQVRQASSKTRKTNARPTYKSHAQLELQRINKSAKAAIEKPITDAIADAIEGAKADSDLNFLKKQKEDEIRMRLDQFAKELSQVKKQRDQHQPYPSLFDPKAFPDLSAVFPQKSFQTQSKFTRHIIADAILPHEFDHTKHYTIPRSQFGGAR